ncbi:hypothetical protein VTG60DRAFT_357 [Thermothelomyces hinnuleus]
MTEVEGARTETFAMLGDFGYSYYETLQRRNVSVSRALFMLVLKEETRNRKPGRDMKRRYRCCECARHVWTWRSEGGISCSTRDGAGSSWLLSGALLLFQKVEKRRQIWAGICSVGVSARQRAVSGPLAGDLPTALSSVDGLSLQLAVGCCRAPPQGGFA